MKTLGRILFLGCLFIAGTGRADSWGIIGGINIADFDYQPPQTSQSENRFTAGFLYESEWAPGFSLQPEVRYVNKGVSGGRYELLTIPVLLKATLQTGNAIAPHLVAGPNFGFKLSGAMKTIDFAIDLGGGVDIQVSDATALLLEVRYSLGMGNVLDNPASTLEAKTRGLQFLTGLKFRM